LKGIEQADSEINQFGISVEKFFYDQSSVESFVEQTKIILQNKPDGVLLAPSFVEESINFVARCTDLQIPFVLMDSDLPTQESLSYIGPNLFHSGYLGAHLTHYLIGKNDKVLIVNISKKIDNHHHLLKKEEGFRAFFNDRSKTNQILKLDIKQTDYQSIEQILENEFQTHPDIKIVFVTNSRVSNVAKYIEAAHQKVILIGYDFLNENIDYLNKEIIDFLICQKPMEQAYRGVMSLYQHLAFSVPVEKNIFHADRYHYKGKLYFLFAISISSIPNYRLYFCKEYQNYLQHSILIFIFGNVHDNKLSQFHQN
jgi:LacI family transcriptional regulator